MRKLELRFDYDAVGDKPDLKTSIVFRAAKRDNEIYIDFLDRNGKCLKTSAFDKTDLQRLRDWCAAAVKEGK